MGRASKKAVTVRVVGGPSGRPIRYPNSRVQRGWSQVHPVWVFTSAEEMTPVVWVSAARYVLRQDDRGRQFYEYTPDPDLEERCLQALKASSR